MLIVCNGVFKSGSSWLHAVIIEILRKHNIPVDKVPHKYTNNVHSPTTIIESKLLDFLANEDYITNNYITKSHYYRSKTMQRYYDKKIYFFFIERDVRDAIVSHYHHVKKKYSFLRELSFNSYYFFLGRLKAFEILNFNRRYRSNFAKESFIRYIDMKNDFESVVMKISCILGLKSLTREEISSIKSSTSIRTMRKKILLGKSKYYSTVEKDRSSLIRKGQVGDWVNYLNKSQQNDIDRLEKNKNVFLLKIFYFILFTFRRRLFRIE